MQVSSLFCRSLRLCPMATIFLMPMMGIFWKLPLKGTEFRAHLQDSACWSWEGCVQFESGECVWHQISEREMLTLGTQILELELKTNQLYPFLSPPFFSLFFSCRFRCMMTAGDGFPRNAGLEVIEHQSFLPLPSATLKEMVSTQILTSECISLGKEERW